MPRVLVCRVALLIGILAVSTTAGPSQSTREVGSVGGTVADSSGVGIADVHISVPGNPLFGLSAANGTFRITNVPVGSRLVVARRIGFLPETVTVTVVAGRTADASMRLDATPQHVATVLVTAVRAQYTGRMRGFLERSARGTGGHFFTPEDIAKRRPRVVTDLIRTLPGARVVTQGGSRVVTFRDLRCLPLVWVDGSPATTGYLDPDLFTPSSLAGIEVYFGPSTIPAELTWVRSRSSCGVIAIWTKVPEARRATAPRKVSAEDLSLLVASLSLFTADQVEVPAAPDSASLAPEYPEGPLREGLAGRVVAEFIVESNGRPDMDSFAAVMSTDPRFTESVRKAVGGAKFRPARHGGRTVRQLVQLPFTFTIPESRGSR